MNTNIAYVDDSQSNLECIGLILESAFEVHLFNDPLRFLSEYTTTAYSAILVDIHMPLMDGFDLYERIIEAPHYDGCPIFFISSDDTDENRIRSFNLGAVDFLNRQISTTELLTRIRSKVAFFQKHRNVIEFGNLKINLTLLKCFLEEEELRLTFIEFKLMTHFIRTFPASSSKEDLVEKIWGNGFVLDATIYTHLFNLNVKLASWDHEVITERNKGMRLARKVASA